MKGTQLWYKNISTREKTFYNVTFKPGEVKSVPGHINSLYMIRCVEPEDKSQTQRVVNKKPSKLEVADKMTSEIENKEET